MTANEILAALEDSEGAYIEVGDWAISAGTDDDGNPHWIVGKYNGPRVEKYQTFSMLIAALEYALKDGKP